MVRYSSRIEVNVHGEKLCRFFRPGEVNGICSNWYRSDFVVDGIHFACVEQYMMYKKAMMFKDFEVAYSIRQESNPGKMKELGRKVKGYREDIWEVHREEIVYRGVLEKFRQNSDLMEWLLSLDADTFVECSPYDSIWGIRLGVEDSRSLYRDGWRGLNLLGKVIGRARDTLRKEMEARNGKVQA